MLTYCRDARLGGFHLLPRGIHIQMLGRRFLVHPSFQNIGRPRHFKPVFFSANAMIMHTLVALALLALAAASAIPAPIFQRNPGGQCPPLHRGTFTVKQFQLYPENADWDAKRCVVYYGYSPFFRRDVNRAANSGSAQSSTEVCPSTTHTRTRSLRS